MRHIKTQMAGLLAVGLAMGVPTAGHAVFSSQQVDTVAASAVVTGGAVSMAVSIKKVADNSADTQLNWTGVTAGSGWTTANNYIQVDSTLTLAGAGIQTYTDNTASDANPKYSGLVSSFTPTPAGLVDGTNTALKLPTAWQITDLVGTNKPAIDPNGGGDGFLWFYHEDKAQVAVPSSNAGLFVNGDPFITVKDTNGIHFAQGPTQFGSAPSPDYIYVEANFQTALGGRTYKTSTLRLELFTQ